MKWMGVERDMFYDTEKIALIPMGFCYPGKGKSGDLPPRPECAPFWHHKLHDKLRYVKLTVLVGQYSQKYYLQSKSTLADNVKNYKEYLPQYFPLPHPSPRNRLWLKNNPWFAAEVLPEFYNLIQKNIN